MVIREYLNFAEPTQVKFIDVNSDNGTDNAKPIWVGGIAYKGEIICGYCGGIIKLEELYADWRDFAHKNFPSIKSPLEICGYWVDISSEITGE